MVHRRRPLTYKKIRESYNSTSTTTQLLFCFLLFISGSPEARPNWLRCRYQVWSSLHETWVRKTLHLIYIHVSHKLYQNDQIYSPTIPYTCHIAKMFKAIFYLITWNSMHHVLHHVVNRVLSPVSSCTKYRVSCNITLTGGVTCCIMDHVDRAVSTVVSCPITCCNISVQFAPLLSRYKVYRGWYKHSDCFV